MSNETWKCSCGTENEGKTCKACGMSKSAVEKYNKDKEISHEERDNCTVEEWAQKVSEHNAKMEEYRNEYNEKVKQVVPNILKGWAGSWIVLALSIFASVAVICTLASLFSNLGKGVFTLLSSMIKLLLNSLVCAGFWRSYIMGRKKDPTLKSGGVKMLKGVVRFYQVIVCLIGILIIILSILIFVGLGSCASDMATSAESVGVDTGGADKFFIGVLIGIVIALIVAFIVIICFFSSVIRFSNEVIRAFDSKLIQPTSNTALAVFFFIVGGFTLIGAIGSIAASNLISGLLGEIGSVGDTLLSSGLFGKTDIGDMLAQLSNAGMFIFGGILALKFSVLHDEEVKQKAAIEKP